MMLVKWLPVRYDCCSTYCYRPELSGCPFQQSDSHNPTMTSHELCPRCSAVANNTPHESHPEYCGFCNSKTYLLLQYSYSRFFVLTDTLLPNHSWLGLSPRMTLLGYHTRFVKTCCPATVKAVKENSFVQWCTAQPRLCLYHSINMTCDQYFGRNRELILIIWNLYLDL